MNGPYDGLTVGDILIRAFRRHGDRVAFEGYGGTYTYRASLDLIGRYQAVFKQLGMRRGEHIAMLNANRAEAYLAGIAAQALGLCTTPLHTLGSLADHQFILEDSETDWLLVDVENYADRGRELVEKVGRLRGALTLGPADFGHDIRAGAATAGAVSAVVEAEASDGAWLSYTGGTTGQPKGAIRSHPAFVAMVTAILADFEFPDFTNYLAVAPISHVGGTKLPAVLHLGGTVTFMNGFDPGKVLTTIEQERISMTLLVPTMIYMLLDHPDLARRDLSSLEYLLYGASPMSPTRLVEGIERIGPVFGQLYGQTEGYPVSVLRKADHDTARPELFTSCGHPNAPFQVKPMDDELNEQPEG